MVFVDEKVAIITGGCSGIGLALVKCFLKHNAKGITIVDHDSNGPIITQALIKEYNCTNVIFVKADVSIKEEFERAFTETIKNFENIDILINNAGILNDATWEKEIAVNINGTIHGCLLGFHEYIPKYRSSEEGIIVNLSSTAGLQGYPDIPIYCGTKHAIIGIGRSWGHEKHYEESKIRVLTICPNATDTPLLSGMPGRNLGPRYNKILQEQPILTVQSTEDVANIVVNIMDSGKNGSIWLVEGGQFCEVNLPTLENLKNF